MKPHPAYVAQGWTPEEAYRRFRAESERGDLRLYIADLKQRLINRILENDRAQD